MVGHVLSTESVREPESIEPQEWSYQAEEGLGRVLSSPHPHPHPTPLGPKHSLYGVCSRICLFAFSRLPSQVAF